MNASLFEESSAKISGDGLYRYNLIRQWDLDLPRVLFVMLNPSTADGQSDDPTVRRCIGFARTWGFGSIEIVNLFAWRATNPRELAKVEDPVGFLNESSLRIARERSSLVIAAWGADPMVRVGERLAIDVFWNMSCLGRTKGGSPRHPLYVAGAQAPEPYLRDGYVIRERAT